MRIEWVGMAKSSSFKNLPDDDQTCQCMVDTIVVSSLCDYAYRLINLY